MAGTTRLHIYNGALLNCGDQLISGLDEKREPRYLLDEVWADNGVRYCLEQAQWHFAMRSTRFTYNPGLQPLWGFQRGFDKPKDWVNTSGVFQDQFLQLPLTQYADEISFWWASVDLIFVKYVSDDPLYGSDMGKWPASFTDYVKAYFASRIVRRLPGGLSKVDDICHPKTGLLNRTLTDAKNKAAMTQPATFPSHGTWAAARLRGRRAGWYDGGNQNALIG